MAIVRTQCSLGGNAAKGGIYAYNLKKGKINIAGWTNIRLHWDDTGLTMLNF